MAKTIRERDYIVVTNYIQEFEIEKGWGYSFACDSTGKVVDKDLERFTRFRDTLQDDKGKPLTYLGMKSWETGYWENAIIECRCGAHVELEGDSECESCGRWYNSGGQTLRPPSQWGEETGEYFDDYGHYVGGGDEDVGI